MANPAAVWPASAQPLHARLGYTTSHGIYLPSANGTTIEVLTGVAQAYAGVPDGSSHRFLATLAPGAPFEVSDLAPGEVLSVQSDSAFTYLATLPPPPEPADTTSSELVTWTCTGSPCPWGSSTSGHAAAWPASAAPVDVRLGYTVSARVYLPAASANGTTIEIASGIAYAYAGRPEDGSHRLLASLAQGQPFEVDGLAVDEVLSIQSGQAFTYVASIPEPPPPEEPTPGAETSTLVTWSCTGGACPWGATFDNHAAAWVDGTTARLGYSASAGVYLPAIHAETAVIEVLSGTAQLYAGLPDAASHRLVASLVPGEPFAVTGLQVGEVLSLQSSSAFTYTAVLPDVEDPPAPEEPGVGSELVTWTCTGSPCPWGSPLSGHALVWSAGGTTTRLGYTTSAAVYLPATSGEGAQIAIVTGLARAYAGLPGASSHRLLATIAAGDTFEVAGLQTGEVLSVQSDSAFTYAAVLPEPPPPEPDPGDPASSSQNVTWTCTTSPCPWGAGDVGHAVVWPSSTNPTDRRLGYTASAGVYLAAGYANGATIEVVSGVAQAYAGTPDAPSHRFLGTLAPGASLAVDGLLAGEVLSIQSGSGFTYRASLAEPPPPEPPAGDVIQSVAAFWKCTAPGCSSPDWVGQAIHWPAWAAYHTNARSGDNARAVFSETGEPLYPYMGSWASGCEVAVVSGRVLIIEWERGTDVWRQTLLEAGDTYVISLAHPEDGAMIESEDFAPGFSVVLDNCEPQPLD